MDTPEKIIETCLHQVRGWTTAARIGCGGGSEIELLAIDPATRRKYRIESELSGPWGQTDLTIGPADYAEPDWRAERRIGHFVDRRFGEPASIAVMAQMGFAPGAYQKAIVALGWTQDAAAAAAAAGIELWDFRQIVRETGARIKDDPSAFPNDTIGAVHWFSTYPDKSPVASPEGLRPDEVVIQSRAFWFFERFTFALVEPASSGVNLWFLDDAGGVFDQLAAATRAEAEAGLQRNNFQPYDAQDPGIANWVHPPRPPFLRRADAIRVYSSGSSWK
jgi:hypothetical protein